MPGLTFTIASLHLQSLDAIADEIQELIDAATVTNAYQLHCRKFPSDRGLEIGTKKLPAIIVSLPPNEAERIGGNSTHGEKDIGYPVWVTFVRAEPQSVAVPDNLVIDEDTDRFLVLREKCYLHFDDQPLTGPTAASIYQTTVEPIAIADASEFFSDKNLLAGAFRVICWARRPPV